MNLSTLKPILLLEKCKNGELIAALCHTNAHWRAFARYIREGNGNHAR
ncbi:MAG: hypothetical protein ACI9NT_000128 [Bacteroidia bacterium]|jgi:hypothetical protein